MGTGMNILRTGAVLTAAALAAAVSGCGSPGSPGPSGTGMTRLWTVSQPNGSASAGVWLDGGTLVTGTDSGLTARSVRTGRTEWTWVPPAAPAGDYWTITMYGTSISGTGVIDYSYESESGSGTGPLWQSGIDLADGHALWTVSLSGSLDVLPLGFLTGGGVVASLDEVGNSNQAYVAAASLATGKPAWSTVSEKRLEDCFFTGLAFSSATAYALATCGDSPAVILYGLSARTGAVESETAIGDQDCEANALGAPTLWAVSGWLLVGCPGGLAVGRQQMVLIRAGSSRQTVVNYPAAGSAFEYPWEHADGPPPYYVAGNVLYIAGNDDKYNLAVTAVSLATGKVLWQEEPPGYLVGAVGSGALIVIKPSDNSDYPPTGMTLSTALMSAASGTVSYGPGTAFNVPNPDDYALYLIGNTVVASAAGTQDTPTIVAYSTGSWPAQAGT